MPMPSFGAFTSHVRSFATAISRVFPARAGNQAAQTANSRVYAAKLVEQQAQAQVYLRTQASTGFGKHLNNRNCRPVAAQARSQFSANMHGGSITSLSQVIPQTQTVNNASVATQLTLHQDTGTRKDILHNKSLGLMGAHSLNLQRVGFNGISQVTNNADNSTSVVTRSDLVAQIQTKAQTPQSSSLQAKQLQLIADKCLKNQTQQQMRYWANPQMVTKHSQQMAALSSGLKLAIKHGTPEIKAKAQQILAMPVVTLAVNGQIRVVTCQTFLKMEQKEALVTSASQQRLTAQVDANLAKIHTETKVLQAKMLDVK